MFSHICFFESDFWENQYVFPFWVTFCFFQRFWNVVWLTFWFFEPDFREKLSTDNPRLHQSIIEIIDNFFCRLVNVLVLRVGFSGTQIRASTLALPQNKIRMWICTQIIFVVLGNSLLFHKILLIFDLCHISDGKVVWPFISLLQNVILSEYSFVVWVTYWLDFRRNTEKSFKS